MPLRKLKSLKTRLFAIVILATLPALGMALLMALDRYAEAKQAALARSQQFARVYSQDGRDLFDRAQTLLLRMAEDHAGHELSGRDCSLAVRLQTRLNPEFKDMTLSLPDGRVLCGIPNRGGQLGAQPWFQEALREQGFVVGRFTADGGGARLPLALAVRGQDGKARAVLSMSLDVPSGGHS